MNGDDEDMVNDVLEDILSMNEAAVQCWRIIMDNWQRQRTACVTLVVHYVARALHLLDGLALEEEGAATGGAERKTRTTKAMVNRQLEEINDGIKRLVEQLAKGNEIAERFANALERHNALMEERQRALLSRVYYPERETFMELQRLNVPQDMIMPAYMYFAGSQLNARMLFEVPECSRLSFIHEMAKEPSFRQSND